ncbi:hypothetical protein BGZ63DRAFT_367115 [Mariannaea sp. PMI_226]|nr:hypothetical protein BGZ63DRAFT_367115 [Mariannaea sp. PMI_226]
MSLALGRVSTVCRQCLRATHEISQSSIAHYSSHPPQTGKTSTGAEDSDKSTSDKNATPKEKELGPLARRLEEATEEALFTGGTAGRRAVEDAGFSEELKDKLLQKIADANFRTQYAGKFAEAELPASAGAGTKHMASAQPWTGQETMADGVLRMLDDAKKPLGPGLRGKFQPPPVDMRLQRSQAKSAGQKVAAARDRASIYVGMDMKSKGGPDEDAREAYRKELRERFEPGSRAMPNTITGLAALANERIENAIARGQFKNIPRGPGVERDARSDNPFIDTTEYIMNKMIQRQDLVPPWIDKQQELTKAVSVFRRRLRNDWKRHATRMIASKGGSLQDQIRRAELYAKAEEVHNPRVRRSDKNDAGPPEPLPLPFRDEAWEKAELSYQRLAIEQLNRLTRSYNLMAPDLAKKGYYSLERELRACFAEVAPEIAKEIQVRASGGRSRGLRGVGGGGEGAATDGDGDGGLIERLSGGKPVRIHVEADEKAYGLKQWLKDLWTK